MSDVDVYRQLLEDELSDLLDDAGVLDTLRAFAALSGDTRGALATLRSAIETAYEMESLARRGEMEMTPEWVRMEAAE